MCPRHEPGMGTDQKPTWDKQGVTLPLADVRQAPPRQMQLYPDQGELCLLIFIKMELQFGRIKMQLFRSIYLIY